MRDIRKYKRVLSIKEGRCELLCVRVELPGTDCNEGRLFNEYYRSIGDAAEAWAGKFAGEIKKEYETLGERERKFRFRRYEYCITSSVGQAEGGSICVRCVFRLVRNRDVLFEREISDLWSAESLLMFGRRPPRGKVWRLMDKICSI
ncbi:MAG TPA: hypothetical protein GX011_02430 [Clostridiales bacterium]|nr:hypothetical protein [Clostridiales bacterium]